MANRITNALRRQARAGETDRGEDRPGSGGDVQATRTRHTLGLCHTVGALLDGAGTRNGLRTG